MDYLIWAVGLLLLAAVAASKASERLGVPALLVFLAIGMLAGSDGPGGIEFDYPRFTQLLGTVALAFILFAGGLDTRWADVKGVLLESALLSTLGVALTAALTAWAAAYLLNIPFLSALLLGSVVSSTDAAAVFSVLRSRKLDLQPRLRSLLEVESGSNDPMAVFLTLALIGLLSQPGTAAGDLPVFFLRQMGLGALLGYGAGRLLTFVVNRINLQYDGLYPALTFALVLVTYGSAALLGGNGFLAVYAAALVMGNSDFLHRRSLLRFHDGLAWLMQIVMFLVLGLQVFPSRLPPVAGAGLAIAAFLMFVARPAAVMALLLFSRLGFRERLLVAWVGLRGAAPIVLATFPLVAGIRGADLIFHVVFFIVLASALVQGTTIPIVARLLRLSHSGGGGRADLVDLIAQGERDLFQLVVGPGSAVDGKRLLDVRLPPETLALLVNRHGRQFVPGGGTVLEAGDRLVLLARKVNAGELRDLLTAR
ncbi:MAG: potassium/proton antiporter [Bryobacteraceae bacterium]